jgi:hypothetical protein
MSPILRRGTTRDAYITGERVTQTAHVALLLPSLTTKELPALLALRCGEAGVATYIGIYSVEEW